MGSLKARRPFMTLTSDGHRCRYRPAGRLSHGTVDDAEMRVRAEQIARDVKHVAGVVNNLTVRAQ